MSQTSQIALEGTLAEPNLVTLDKPRITQRTLSYLQLLEAESIHIFRIFREAATEFARPVMLYSMGKDSSVMLRLADFILIRNAAETGQDARNSIFSVYSGRTFDLDRENLPADNETAVRDAFQTVKKWLATSWKAGGA